MIRSQSFTRVSHFFFLSGGGWGDGTVTWLEWAGIDISFLPHGRIEVAGVEGFPFPSELVSYNTPAGYVFNSFPLRAGPTNKNMLTKMYFKMFHFPLTLPEQRDIFI